MFPHLKMFCFINSGNRNTFKRTFADDEDGEDEMALPDSVIDDEENYVHDHPDGILLFVYSSQVISKYSIKD